MAKNLNKTAAFTDIHFGRQSNSDQHNQDCLDFITWFCDEVKKDPEIDSIAFLGDWNENRSAINLSTLDYSYRGAKMLNDLGLPVFFVVGNHDLYYRHSRDIHSIVPFQEFSNFTMIDKPTIIPNLGDGALLCPFIFESEFHGLKKFTDCATWWGHFEFKGFAVTGYGTPATHGAVHTDFEGPSRIFSGHFHKRQNNNNVYYIGNAFPMDYGDAGDNERGMAIYTYDTDKLQYKNWEDCPKYLKLKLSEILDLQEAGTFKPSDKTRVDCIVDITISYEDSMKIKQSVTTDFNIREINLTETKDVLAAVTDTEIDEVALDENKAYSLDEAVVYMLENIKVKKISNDMLVHIYQGLVI
jgi:DNA repair exonuclease SbcCD nuclease subunit